MHAGSREVRDFVRARERDWRWWDNPDIQRPLVSIVAVRPEDEFETARPAKGITLRVRCAWQNTPQGLLKQPITELVKLSLDGMEVSPSLASRKRPNGLLDEHHHSFHIERVAPGQHIATATVRILDTNAEQSRSLKFTI